ncbi:MAG TPA: hypothetical protein VF062_29645 [Candidatus Limnocylindrales bacterium]
MTRSPKSARLLATIALVFAAAACDASSGDDGTGGSTGGAGDANFNVAEPAANASVSVPFMVKVNSSEALGTTETGNHHIHVWFDGNEAEYKIGYGDSVQITEQLSPGAHKMTVSLRHANHSDAGPRVEVPITVGSGDGTAPQPTVSEDDDGYVY